MLRIFLILLLLLFNACASTSGSRSSGTSSEVNIDDDMDDDDEGFGSEGALSPSGPTLMFSLGKNRYAQPRLSMQKINEQVDALASKPRLSRADLENLIAAQGLARRPFGEIWQNAQKLSRMIKGNKGIADAVKLNLGIAALRARKYAIADYYLTPLSTEARRGRIKASANNAIGIMHLLNKNYQDASLAFKRALSAAAGYRPAAFNLGLLQLRFGDFATARRVLGDLPPDWFINASMLIIERHLGNIARANGLCKKVLQQRPNHKMSKLNCAIIEFKENKNYKKARKLLQDAAKISGGGEFWENMIYKLLEEIDTQEFNKKLQAAAPTPLLAL